MLGTHLFYAYYTCIYLKFLKLLIIPYVSHIYRLGHTHLTQYKTFIFGEKWVGPNLPRLPVGYATGTTSLDALYNI